MPTPDSKRHRPCGLSSRPPVLSCCRNAGHEGEQQIASLRDRVGVQDEHSHVDAENSPRIAELVSTTENEPFAQTARRLSEQLQPQDVAAIVMDWLEVQVAV